MDGGCYLVKPSTSLVLKRSDNTILHMTELGKQSYLKISQHKNNSLQLFLNTYLLSDLTIQKKKKKQRSSFKLLSTYESVALKCKKRLHFEVLKLFCLKLPNSLRKLIKKNLHFKIFTFQNVKFKMSG